MLSRLALVVTLVLALSAGHPVQGSEPPSPETLGPYAVGRTTFVMVDGARARTLPVDVWYPVDPGSASGPRATYDFGLGGLLPGVPPYPPTFAPLEPFFDPWLIAVEDAAPSAAGPFPLIIESHGGGGIRYSDPRRLEALASHGFIVAACDHPGTTVLDRLFGTYSDAAGVIERPRDLSLLITEMLTRNEAPSSPLFGRIDPARVGVTGVSFGGYAAIAAAAGFGDSPPDGRVRAVLPISPATSLLGVTEETLGRISVPILILAERTGFFAIQSEAAYHAVASRQRYLALVDGVWHFQWAAGCDIAGFLSTFGVPPELIFSEGPFTACPPGGLPQPEIDRLRVRYSVAFFKRHLAGDHRYAPFLTPAGSSNPAVRFLGGVGPDRNGNGTADEADIASCASVDHNRNGIPDESEAEVLFVDASARGSGAGTSWRHALPDLQDALRIARARGARAREIRVAAGVYRPHPSDRRIAFVLPSRVRVSGGFPPGGGGIGARDPLAHPTVLSGDLAGDDGPLFAGTDENSHNVVTAIGTGRGTAIDGFTIVGGRADGPDDRVRTYGGGLYVECAAVAVEGCRFTGGVALAGGAFAVRSNLSPSDVAFLACTFAGNAATFGGAIEVEASEDSLVAVALTNCLIAGNGAFLEPIGTGGGIDAFGPSWVSIVNCTLAGNAAADAGGGVNAENGAHAELRNSILASNAAPVGADLSLRRSGDHDQSATADLAFVNIAGGTAGVAVLADSVLLLGSSIIAGDPMFVDAAAFDFRLMAGSPCVDAGDNRSIARRFRTDLAGAPRFRDDLEAPDTGSGRAPLVDLGAFER